MGDGFYQPISLTPWSYTLRLTAGALVFLRVTQFLQEAAHARASGIGCMLANILHDIKLMSGSALHY